ncbi:MAG: hypothetical protein COV99_10420 [Bacteroidetes bacterium CG12_big_fil_rev_8_21_14_0_65_60_17]|nr:MAG: hypothetical protein COV99_10420 [Bacteroidetes bacterium CG12_big_fil_rev_8_21_14_0_65_60_17]
MSEDYLDSRAAPSVSREKWALHAHAKMSKGYVLIVSTARRSANFFMPGKGYDPCPIITAKRLIEQGLVVADGRHPLGERYILAPDADPARVAPKGRVDDDDDDDATADSEDLADVLDAVASDDDPEGEEGDEDGEEDDTLKGD